MLFLASTFLKFRPSHLFPVSGLGVLALPSHSSSHRSTSCEYPLRLPSLPRMTCKCGTKSLHASDSQILTCIFYPISGRVKSLAYAQAFLAIAITHIDLSAVSRLDVHPPSRSRPTHARPFGSPDVIARRPLVCSRLLVPALTPALSFDGGRSYELSIAPSPFQISRPMDRGQQTLRGVRSVVLPYLAGRVRRRTVGVTCAAVLRHVHAHHGRERRPVPTCIRKTV